MCGIAGIFNFRKRSPVDPGVLSRMGTIQAHRGPDADGVYIAGDLGFAHRRLAIIDLDERGRQPMATPDGRYTLVYNGEIYNYVELRDELRREGCTFRTDTDTEVLLTLFAREGAACLSRLNGMFAFAVWDSAARQLLIARDRVGIKPLYYAIVSDGIIFGSEAKALFEHPGLDASLDDTKLSTYLSFGYVPGEATLFRGVRKLLPGHYLRVNASGVSDSCYWDVEYRPAAGRDARATAEELHALLLDAARIHMRSDVPVGVFLSGGLDSSAVVGLLRESGVSDIQTFSVAYAAGGEFDETPYAQAVATHFETRHRVLYVEPDEFKDFIPDYVWHMDEPVTEAAAISLFFVSKLLRQHVTVAQSGEGADELFAGYQIYSYMQWLERYRTVPQGIRQALLDPLLLACAPAKVQKYVRLSQLPLEHRYMGVSLYSAENAASLYTAEYARHAPVSAPWGALEAHYSRTANADPLTRMLYTDLKTWLVDDLLIKADKMTMANSVELRVPFLDYRVVEFAATVPSSMKLRNGTAKWILKEAMRGLLPEATLKRRKVGFPTPLTLMFRKDLSGYLRDLLLSSRSRQRGIFRMDRIEQLIVEHRSGQRDHQKLLWQLVVLEEWQRRFIDPSIGSRQHLAPVAAAT